MRSPHQAKPSDIKMYRFCLFTITSPLINCSLAVVSPWVVPVSFYPHRDISTFNEKLQTLLLTLFRNCTRHFFSVLMKNCQWETESKHVRQIHFRCYRLAICPPSLAKTQRTTTIKRTNRSNLRKIRIEGKALSMHSENWVRIFYS